jgi:hypothetical protein
MKKKSSDKFSKAESKRRFEAALRGARTIGPKLMKESDFDEIERGRKPIRSRKPIHN